MLGRARGRRGSRAGAGAAGRGPTAARRRSRRSGRSGTRSSRSARRRTARRSRSPPTSRGHARAAAPAGSGPVASRVSVALSIEPWAVGTARRRRRRSTRIWRQDRASRFGILPEAKSRQSIADEAHHPDPLLQRGRPAPADARRPAPRGRRASTSSSGSSIDDGSTDETVAVARAHGVDHLVRLTNNKGLAAGFQAGHRHRAEARRRRDRQHRRRQPVLRRRRRAGSWRPILDGRADMVDRRPRGDAASSTSRR